MKYMNRIVGVTSGMADSKKVMALSSSIPGSSFFSAYNMACNQAAGNCSN